MSSNLAFSSSTSERYARALYELVLEKSELDRAENEIKNLQNHTPNKNYNFLLLWQYATIRGYINRFRCQHINYYI